MKFTLSNRMKNVKGSAIREMFKRMADPSVISMAGGNPSPDLFPTKEFASIAAEILTQHSTTALQYGVTEGYTPLRDTVRRLQKERENIGRNFDDTIIVSGGQQGIELISKLFLNEGDCVIVEAPSFVGALNAFRSYGANLIGVPMERDGMSLTALKKVIGENRNVKLIYTIPSFQNPTGITMSEEKRKALYEIARDNGIFILEDNPYGELTYNGKKFPTVKSFDEDGSVIYCSSFSKILAPALRIGYLTAHKDIIEKAVIAKQAGDVHTPLLTQMIACEFLNRYPLDGYIDKIRTLYRHKADVMLKAIEQYFPKCVTHTVPSGGIFLYCTLPDNQNANSLMSLCAERKVAIISGNTFAVDTEAPCNGFRLNFSTASDENIIEGIKRVGEALNELLS